MKTWEEHLARLRAGECARAAAYGEVVAFWKVLDAEPGVWFAAPEVIAPSCAEFRWPLDPSVYEVWRDSPDGQLWARKRARPLGIPGGAP